MDENNLELVVDKNVTQDSWHSGFMGKVSDKILNLGMAGFGLYALWKVFSPGEAIAEPSKKGELRRVYSEEDFKALQAENEALKWKLKRAKKDFGNICIDKGYMHPDKAKVLESSVDKACGLQGWERPVPSEELHRDVRRALALVDYLSTNNYKVLESKVRDALEGNGIIYLNECAQRVASAEKQCNPRDVHVPLYEINVGGEELVMMMQASELAFLLKEQYKMVANGDRKYKLPIYNKSKSSGAWGDSGDFIKVSGDDLVRRIVKNELIMLNRQDECSLDSSYKNGEDSGRKPIAVSGSSIYSNGHKPIDDGVILEAEQVDGVSIRIPIEKEKEYVESSVENCRGFLDSLRKEGNRSANLKKHLRVYLESGLSYRNFGAGVYKERFFSAQDLMSRICWTNPDRHELLLIDRVQEFLDDKFEGTGDIYAFGFIYNGVSTPKPINTPK
jgi:hypothetical protein